MPLNKEIKPWFCVSLETLQTIPVDQPKHRSIYSLYIKYWFVSIAYQTDRFLPDIFPWIKYFPKQSMFIEDWIIFYYTLYVFALRWIRGNLTKKEKKNIDIYKV